MLCLAYIIQQKFLNGNPTTKDKCWDTAYTAQQKFLLRAHYTTKVLMQQPYGDKDVRRRGKADSGPIWVYGVYSPTRGRQFSQCDHFFKFILEDSVLITSYNTDLACQIFNQLDFALFTQLFRRYC